MLFSEAVRYVPPSQDVSVVLSVLVVWLSALPRCVCMYVCVYVHRQQI